MYKPYHARGTTISGLVLSAILTAPFVILLVLMRRGPSQFFFFFILLFSLVIGLLLIFTISGSRLSYEVREEELRIDFGIRKIRIPYRLMKDAQLTSLTLIFRIFGGGWPGLYWGLFRAKDAGNIQVYSTRWRGEFVVISTLDGRRIAISPAEPEKFLADIISKKAEFGTASQSEVKKSQITAIRIVHGQVLTVALAYVFFLAYFLTVYQTLPQIVPIHFDINWVPNRWADKSELLIIAALSAIFPLLNTVLVVKYGRYSKDLVLFLGVVFILIIALFATILHLTCSYV